MDTSLLKDNYAAEEIIGLDLSCNSSGYSYYSGGQYHTGVIKAPTGKKKLDDIERLSFFFNEFTKLIEPLPHIRLAVVEGYSMGSKGSGLKVRETGGIAKTILHMRGVSILLIAPSSLKLFATGNGAADRGDSKKTLIREAAKVKFGIERTTTDEIDAFWLLQVGMYATGSNPQRDRQRLAMIERIKGAELFINRHSKGDDHGKARTTSSSSSRPSITIRRLRRNPNRGCNSNQGRKSSLRITRN